MEKYFGVLMQQHLLHLHKHLNTFSGGKLADTPEMLPFECVCVLGVPAVTTSTP